MPVTIIRGEPEKESLVPDPNGVNTDFQTSVAYKSGTVSVWLNGIRLVDELDTGFLELGGNTIRMKEAPLTGDSIQAMYEPL